MEEQRNVQKRIST